MCLRSKLNFAKEQFYKRAIKKIAKELKTILPNEFINKCLCAE